MCNDWAAACGDKCAECSDDGIKCTACKTGLGLIGLDGDKCTCKYYPV